MSRGKTPALLLVLIALAAAAQVFWLECGRHYHLALKLVKPGYLDSQNWYMNPKAAAEPPPWSSEGGQALALLRRDRARSAGVLSLLLSSSDPTWRLSGWRLIAAGAGSLREHETLVERGSSEPDALVRNELLRAVSTAALNPDWERASGESPPVYSWVARQLEWALADPDPEVRRRALMTYSLMCKSGLSPTERQLQIAEERLEDGDPGVREQAILTFLYPGGSDHLDNSEQRRTWRRRALARVLRRPITSEIGMEILGLDPHLSADVALLILEHEDPELARTAQNHILGHMFSWGLIDRYPDEASARMTIRQLEGKFKVELRRRGYAWREGS